MATSFYRRLNYSIGPVVAGMIIDAIDFITFGPIGLLVGLPVGAAAGFWLAQCLGLDKKVSAICALIAGIYCTIPYTELLPLGTLVGALVRFQESEPVDEPLEGTVSEKAQADGSPAADPSRTVEFSGDQNTESIT